MEVSKQELELRKYDLTRKIRAKGSMNDPDFFKWNRELQHVVARLTHFEHEVVQPTDEEDVDALVRDLML